MSKLAFFDDVIFLNDITFVPMTSCIPLIAGIVWEEKSLNR